MRRKILWSLGAVLATAGLLGCELTIDGYALPVSHQLIVPLAFDYDFWDPSRTVVAENHYAYQRELSTAWTLDEIKDEVARQAGVFGNFVEITRIDLEGVRLKATQGHLGFITGVPRMDYIPAFAATALGEPEVVSFGTAGPAIPFADRLDLDVPAGIDYLALIAQNRGEFPVLEFEITTDQAGARETTFWDVEIKIRVHSRLRIQ